MKEQTLYILCGEAFAGKSTLAKKIKDYYDAKIVGRDQVYFACEEILVLESTSDEDDDLLWKNMWPLVIQGVKNHLMLGNSVVVDDNCLYLRQRDELRSVAKECNVKSILIYLDTPNEVLKKRKELNKVSKTRHDVPSEWMVEDAQAFERPTDNEKPIPFNSDDEFEVLTKKL